MTYGIGTRSYNRSREAREARKASESNLRRIAREGFVPPPEYKRVEVIVGPMCECAAFPYPHEAQQHISCLTRQEHEAWEAWVNGGRPSYLWDGWAALGKSDSQPGGKVGRRARSNDCSF